MDNLPGILQLVAAAGGLEAARALARERGGRRIYIPATPHPEHWLTCVIGLPAADALCSTHGGETVLVPLWEQASRARLHHFIRAHLACGYSTTTVARMAGVHIRTVERLRNTAKYQQK